MTNREKYNNVFIESFDVSEEQLEKLKYQDVPTWDSVGHMGLVGELEDTFDFEFEADDIVDFDSYAKGIMILKKYDIIVE